MGEGKSRVLEASYVFSPAWGKRSTVTEIEISLSLTLEEPSLTRDHFSIFFPYMVVVKMISICTICVVILLEIMLLFFFIMIMICVVVTILISLKLILIFHGHYNILEKYIS